MPEVKGCREIVNQQAEIIQFHIISFVRKAFRSGLTSWYRESIPSKQDSIGPPLSSFPLLEKPGCLCAPPPTPSMGSLPDRRQVKGLTRGGFLRHSAPAC